MGMTKWASLVFPLCPMRPMRYASLPVDRVFGKGSQFLLNFFNEQQHPPATNVPAPGPQII
jgi:hypothetical protein